MLETLLTAVASFASTNIDDIFVLTILYAQVQGPRGVARVVAGQYLGIGALVALSIAGALGAQLFPSQYIGLLGFLPLALGIRSWIGYRRGGAAHDDAPRTAGQVSLPGVAALTIANGADNIGVYIPVFSGFAPADFAITLGVFAAMIALWCYLGHALANQPLIRGRITRYQGVLVPAVLMLLGVSILARNYVF